MRRVNNHDSTSIPNAHRITVQVTKEEYDDLLKAFRRSELAKDRFQHETYASNTPEGEYARRLLVDTEKVDFLDYDATMTVSRQYSRSLHLQLPRSQYENLHRAFMGTPIANDTAGRGCYAGNSQFAEYLRRCLKVKVQNQTPSGN